MANIDGSGERYLVIEGSPFDRGYQHGSAFRPQIQELSRKVLPRVLLRIGDLSNEALLDEASAYVLFVEQYAPHLAEEIAGIAQGAQITTPEAYLLQLRPELSEQPDAAPAGCTTIAIPSSKSDSGNPMIAQNVDLSSELEPFGTMLEMVSETGAKILAWTLMGTLGQTGLNSFGIARCGNGLYCPGWKHGLPLSVLFRLVLEQRSLADAERVVREGPRTKGNNFLMADSQEIVNIEFTPQEVKVADIGDRVFCHTNHYLDPELTLVEACPFIDNSIKRFGRVKSLTETSKSHGAEDLFARLGDHDGFPDSICGHGGGGMETIGTCVLEPAKATMHISFGNPCTSSWNTYRL